MSKVEDKNQLNLWIEICVINMQTLVLAWCYRQELEVLASNLMKLQEGLSPEDKCDKDQGYYGCISML